MPDTQRQRAGIALELQRRWEKDPHADVTDLQERLKKIALEEEVARLGGAAHRWPMPEHEVDSNSAIGWLIQRILLTNFHISTDHYEPDRERRVRVRIEGELPDASMAHTTIMGLGIGPTMGHATGRAMNEIAARLGAEFPTFTVES